MAAARFVVGIDLGTTHTVVAFAEPRAGHAAEVRVFDLPQLVTPRDVASRPLLPSLLYAPLAEESIASPWSDPPWVTGEVARARGAEVPGRLVASAKSWLCHAGADRTAAILPWGRDAHDAAPRISPVDASARLLVHVRRAWDEAHPDAPLADQDVVLTVPASFDQAARELTVAASRAAGLSVRLLEEPQAAFYDYRAREGDAGLRALLGGGEARPTVLVCDVGGGTCDFSLFRVEASTGGSGGPGGIDVSRVAVGRHLLLGGDNMDLALAHLCESRFDVAALDPARFAQLVLAARRAKELLLGPDAPEDTTVSVASAGSQLVGTTRRARLERLEVEAMVLDGFFPVSADAPDAKAHARAGLVGFGLPYERDVAVTRHLASFFRRHAPEASAPRALLFNGGVFHSPRIVARVLESVGSWGGAPPVVLAHTDPDVAVARGAVAYALARRGEGAVIGGGAARGYYVAVDDGRAGERAVVCVVPRGTAEGQAKVASRAPLAIVVGRPVRFDLFACDNARGHEPGDVVPLASLDAEPLPPVVARFAAGATAEPAVRVVLEGVLTAVGSLELACVEAKPRGDGEPARRFELAFDLRIAAAEPAAPPPRDSVAPAPIARPLADALTAIQRVFGKGATDVSPREGKDLVRELERLLGDKGGWDLPTTRALFDAVFAGHKGRRRSADHERVFWQLAGFCLRPGVGHPLDPDRVSGLQRLLPERLAFLDSTRGWQQFWFAWRRVSAGLDAPAQTALRDLLDPVLAPREAGLRPPKGFRPDALDAALETASFLERVDPARRAQLGAWILERTWTDRDPRLWSALGRLGARVPAYATVDRVVPAGTVERWVDHLLREKWGEVPTAAEAAVRMARVSGDRARDLPERVRKEVATRLRGAGAAEDAIRAVLERVTVEEQERAACFGESLPVGLKLVTSE